MSDDEGNILDDAPDAPLCLCCEGASAARVFGRLLRDGDLQAPVCHECGLLLARACAALNGVPGIKGCAALGPDSGKGVRS